MKKKMREKISSRFLATVLSVLMLASLFPVELIHASETGSASVKDCVADGEILVKDTVTPITDGVVSHEVITNVPTGDQQHIDYIAEVAMGENIKIVSGYGQDDASSWSLTPTTTQAKAYEKNHPGETVVAAINADFFNMATGEPMGALVMNGKIICQANGRNYFGVTKDGKAVIRNTPDLSDLQTAVGGDVILVNNGEVVPENGSYGALKYSRTAIGIRADGTVLTFVTYGLRAPISCGRTYDQMAQMLKNAGCVSAIALDGGGSSTYCARPEGTDKLVVSNSPADGAERAVSSSLLVVSTAVKTGVFDHAVLTPNNEVYTPGSTVQFEAKGVDTAGMAMDLPAGATYAISADSQDLGSVDAQTGLVTIGEKCGTLGVELRLNGETVGSTTIDVAVPDSIYFANEEISLGFTEETDFGLVVRSKNRDMNIKAGDIQWSIENVKTAAGDAATAEEMGAFNGNSFTSSDGKSLNGTFIAASKWDESVKGSIHVIVGMLPTIVWDFEDQKDAETGAVTSAEDYYVGENGILTHSNYGRGGQESVEIVSIDDDEPVRFGSKSLKLNYDYTRCGAVTEGACVGTTAGMTIPGVPTGIGVWVYAPEGMGIEYKGDGTQAGFWLRGYVRDGNGSNQPYDFVLEPKACVTDGKWNGVQPGISWEGWKYLEADLTKLAAPYSIQPGMTFRLMYVDGTKMGTKTAGAVYFDNLQFVYGTNVDDVDAPVVDSITVNGKELENGAVLQDAKLNITAMFHDVQNKYTSGIDKDTIRMYIDDINVVGNDRYEYAAQPDGTMNYLYNLELENGEHTVTVFLRDEFGNETTETRTFTVKKAAPAATVQVKPLEQTAIIGKTVDLQLLASDTSVAQATAILTRSNLFPNYEVLFADGYEGTYSYSKLSKKLTVNVVRKTDAQPVAGDNGCLMATVRVSIPANLTESTLFSYTVKGGSFLTDSGAYATYHQSEATLPVGAEYTISSHPIIVSESGTGTLTVVNSKGEPAVGVGIYMATDNSLVGTTDEKGQLTTDAFGKTAGTYTVYAKDEAGLLSFQYNVGVYDVAEKTLPYNVRFNAPKNEATEKNISWISNPAVEGQQSIRYAVSGTENWVTAEAKTTQMNFTQGGYITANFNNILLTGLSADTTYDYQVGCGDLWTDKATFATSDGEKDHADFFVLGDIQADDLTNITAIRDTLKDRHWNFGLQTGDAVDNPRAYKDWEDYTGLFNGETMGSTNMVQVLGNHELQGEALESKIMFGLDASYGGSCYSRTYGNVYLAVINYTGNAAQLRSALEWLKTDVQSSNADWKILTMHQPPYYTNESGGNAEIYGLVPKVVDELGIDVVFSGHDHSLARTNMLRGDEIDEDHGAVYYICGTSGEKSYSITSQGTFDYDRIFALATLDFTAIYLTAHADRDTLTINVYDIAKSAPIDTITLKSDCAKFGHKCQLDTTTKKAVCTVCGRTDETLTGDIMDAEGNAYYMLGGVLQTGWVTVGEEIRYYNPETCIREKVTAVEKPSTCIVDGYCDYTSASGATKHIDYTDAGGHEYVVGEDGAAVCEKCGHVRVDMDKTNVSLSYNVCTYTGKARTPSTTAVTQDGTILTKTGIGRDYYSTYKNNVEVGTATVTLTAAKYGIYVDLNQWRGNCKGSITVPYEIRPDLPTNVQMETQGDKTVFSWKAALCEPEYILYRTADGKTFEKFASTKDTHISVPTTDIYGYAVMIGTMKMGSDNKEYYSLKMTNGTPVKPVVAGDVRGESGKPALSWFRLANVDHYEIYRAQGTSNDFAKLYETNYLSYSNTSAVPGTTYTYKVRAIFKDGTASPFSEAVTITAVCPQVTKLAVGGDESGRPLLTWAAANGANGYEVYRSESADGEFVKVASVSTTKYADTAAENGKTYYYYVIAVKNDAASGLRSDVVSTTAVYPQVTKLAVGGDESGRPLLTWAAVNGANGYAVYRSESADGEFVKVASVSTTKYADTAAENGKTYYYYVIAVKNDAAYGLRSDVVSTTVELTVVEPVVGARQADGKPTLHWNKLQNAVSYQVYRATKENGEYVRVFTTKGLTYTHVSAEAGKTYFYKVKALFADGTNQFSEFVSATFRPVSLNFAPVAGNRNTDGKPTLRWNKLQNAVSYQVYRADSKDGKYVRVFTTKGLTYTHISAEAGKTYFYKVKALFADGTNQFSEFVSATFRPVSLNFAPVAGNRNTDGKPTLRWNKLQNAVSYQVYRADSKDGKYVRVFTTKGLTYTHVSAQLDKTYYYKVKAVFSDGSTVFSEILSNTCTCGRPEVTVGHRAADGLPRLKWAPVDGAQSYAVYRATKADGKYVRVFKTTGTTYTHISAQPDTTYYYKVVAVTPQGHTGVFSEVLKASIQTP